MAAQDDYKGVWRIKRHFDIGGDTRSSLEVVNALPSILEELHAMGYDLTAITEMARKIEKEQRDHEAAQVAEKLKVALKERALLSAQDVRSRRFVVAYAKIAEPGQCIIAEGVEHGEGGRVTIFEPHKSFGTFVVNMESYKRLMSESGKEHQYHIEYID